MEIGWYPNNVVYWRPSLKNCFDYTSGTSSAHINSDSCTWSTYCLSWELCIDVWLTKYTLFWTCDWYCEFFIYTYYDIWIGESMLIYLSIIGDWILSSVAGFEQNRSSRCWTRSCSSGDWRGWCTKSRFH